MSNYGWGNTDFDFLDLDNDCIRCCLQRNGF